MFKQGILHDYDLMANEELSSKNQSCIICGDLPIIFQWSDYSGEAMCNKCGFPYQLKWGTDEQQKEGKYPYINVKDEFIPIIKRYWNEFRKFVCYGTMLGNRPGYSEFEKWVILNYPDMCNNKKEK